MRVLGRDEVDAVPAGDDGHREAARQGFEERGRAREAYAVARIEHGTRGALELLQHMACGLGDIRATRFLLRRRIETAKRFRVDEAALHIDGYIEPARAWPAALRHAIGVFERCGKLLRLFDHLRILRHVVQCRHDVELLPAQRAQRQTAPAHRQRGLHLPRDDEQRDRVLISARDAVQGVDRAWSARHAERRHVAVDARIRLRRHRRRLLMVAVRRPELRVMPDRVVEMHGAAAHDREDMLDALLHEEIRNVVRCLDLHGTPPFLQRGTAVHRQRSAFGTRHAPRRPRRPSSPRPPYHT